MRRGSGSAPGKVILLGEHFVVHGSPALAAAISLRASASVELTEGRCVEVLSNALGTSRFCEEELKGETAPYASIARSSGISGGCRIEISSEIPPASGLGSSAATSVAVAAACLSALGVSPSERELVELSMVGERMFHARPSGIDVVVSVIGGLILFRGVDDYERVEARGLERASLLVVDTGVPRSTKRAVEEATRRLKASGSVGLKLLEAAREIVEEGSRAAARGDLERLGELMRINHGLLSAIGVSFPEAELAISAALRAGAIGAKITGAGLGGSVLVLAERGMGGEVRAAVERALPTARVIETSIEPKGAL
ncbi:MAG: mevalonate kinase [Fervidicoccaceae archaeon]